MTSNAQMTNTAINELERLIKVQSFSDMPVDYFADKILPTWTRATKELENLGDDADPTQQDGFRDRITSARIKLQAVITSRIDKVITAVEEDGNTFEINQWLLLVQEFNILTGNEQKKLGNAKEVYEKYSKSQQDYSITIEKLNTARIELKLKGSVDNGSYLKNLAEDTKQSLAQTIKELKAHLPEKDSRLKVLESWVKEIEVAYEPFLLHKSILDSLKVSGNYETIWNALTRLKDLNVQFVSYSMNPDASPDLDSKIYPSVPIDQAISDCEGRWKRYSEEKFWEYIQEYNDKIKAEKKEDGITYVILEDPEIILNTFENKTQRVLRPIDELENTKGKYEQFISKLRPAITITKRIKEKLDAIDTTVRCRPGSISELDKLKTELEEKTPFLVEKWTMKREELVKAIENTQLQKLKKLKINFGINVESAGQEAGKYAEQLHGYPEFKNFEEEFRNLATLSTDINRQMNKVEKQEPEKASETIKELLAVLDKHPDLPKPRRLLDLQEQVRLLLEPAGQSNELIELVEKALREYVLEINENGKLENPADALIDLQEYADRIKQIQDALNKLDESGKPFTGAKKIRTRIENTEKHLLEVEAWVALYAELQKPGADLAKAQSYAKTLQDNPRQLVEEDQVRALAERLGQIQAGDEQVQKAIHDVNNAVINQQAGLKALLDAWDTLDAILTMPTTLAAERTRAKANLRTRLVQACKSYLQEFEQSPRNASTSLVRRALNWMQIHSAQQSLDEFSQAFIGRINAALHEALAWEAFQKGKYLEALAHWRDAENSNRPGARMHRLALLKFVALSHARKLEFQYLGKALAEKELKDDVDLCALFTEQVIDAVDHKFEDLAVIREGKEIVEFEKGSLGLANLLSWAGIQNSETGDEKDETFEGKFVEVWEADGYPELLRQKNIAFPQAPLVIQEARYRPAVYNSLSAVFQKVGQTSSLADLDLGRRSAENLIAKHQWFTIAKQLLEQKPELKELFKEKWDEYRNLVVQNL